MTVPDSRPSDLWFPRAGLFAWAVFLLVPPTFPIFHRGSLLSCGACGGQLGRAGGVHEGQARCFELIHLLAQTLQL